MNISLQRQLYTLWFALITLMMAGCSWLDDDDNELPELEVKIAPTAQFTASVESGMAALTVEFSDTSTNGSASINQWNWEFGDGNTSSEQNPTHTYDAAGAYSVSLTVSSDDGSDTVTKNNFIMVDEPLVSLRLSVVDTEGVLLQDVEISSADFDIFEQTPTDQGYQLSITPAESEGILTIRKSGYIRNILYMETMQVNQDTVVVLKEKAPPIIFDALAGGTFYGPDGISVEISGRALARADGMAATGDIELYITPVDISDPFEQSAFPGSYLGTNDEGVTRDLLFSYGVFDITFEQDGEELQLGGNNIARLNVPLYASRSFENVDLEPGDVIPFWYLDEQTGLWQYESDGVVEDNPLAPYGLSLRATTTHFTAFNADMNPPGLSGSGGSGGGNTDDRLCGKAIDLVGADEGEQYLYTIAYTRPGWPVSKRQRSFTYNNEQLTQNVLRGFYISVTVSKNEIEGSTSFVCNSDAINRTIILGDSEPEIIDFQPRVEPEWGRDSEGLSEIVSNTVYVGAYWLGADIGTFNSSILPTPIALTRGIYREVEYTADAPDSVEISLDLNNDFGTTSAQATVSYIREQAPSLGYSYAVYDSTSNSTLVRWYGVEGADELTVYYVSDLEQDPLFSVTPNIVIDSSDGEVEFDGNANDGYLFLEFKNRYGVANEYIVVGGAPRCGSDGCDCGGCLDTHR